jgi:hypothetical protein
MSSDESYLSFLDSANKSPIPTSTHTVPSTGHTRSTFDPTISSPVPEPLKNLDVYYTSDTDSPFEPVFLNFSGGEAPSVEDFEKCLGVKEGQVEVEELSVAEFDPRGEYVEVVRKVEQVAKGKGGVKVFRVGMGGTRYEYYIVSVVDKGLVGVRAKAIES